MNTLEKRLIALQQRLDNLNDEVADLIAMTSATQPTSLDSALSTNGKSLPNRPATSTSASTVGLTRFHQLAEAAV